MAYPQFTNPGLPGPPYNRTTSYPAVFSPAGTPAGGYPPFNAPFNGVPYQTRRHEPPSSLHPQLSSQTSFSSVDTQSPGPIKGLARDDQIERLAASFRRKNKKIGVFYDLGLKQRADSIVRRLNDLLSGGVCIVQGFEILPQTSNWLQIALSGGVDFFIFVGLPPKTQPQNPSQFPQTNQITEADFFDVRKYVQRVAEVVVVFPLPSENESSTRYSRSPHYLDNFLRLESNDMDKVAGDALALFAAPRPKPFATDNAYFSEIPKLVAIPKKSGKSLGLSIMTREMSPDSEFPRVVLIKSFGSECVDDVKRKLGRYTHIQSYNGVFLDGMDIKDVTSVFQSMKSSMAYLTIRYIHPVQSATPTRGPEPTTPTRHKPEAPRMNPSKEELPIPLYILGYIHRYSKKLFDLLKEQEAHSPVSNSSSSSVAATPISELSTQVSFSADQPPFGIDSSQEDGSDIVASLDTVDKGIASTKRIRSRSLAQSDESFIRAFTSEKLFNELPAQTFDRTPSYPGNGVHPTGLLRQGSRHAPQTGKKRYILQLPQQKLDASFTHIFFRRSGIYLLTVGLMEMMGDPLIQFENLCYWLRQVQTYVGPENVKRIVIVGVHDATPGDTTRLSKIDKFTAKLEKAIREADFKQIMEISREKLIITFNLNTPEASTRLLCQCINNCMNVMMERVWCYEQSSGFFEQTFQPFTQLSSVAGKISGIKAIVATSADIEDCYIYSDKNYKKTLANYTLACINPEGEYHLIRPSFLIELLLSMEMNSHNYMIHATNINALKKLPVVSAPFPKTQMETLVAQRKEFAQLVPVEEDAILEWADNLEIVYSLSKVKEHMLYFIPFLATEAMGEQANFDWDQDEAEGFQAPDMTILYAEMHIPASYQLFYGLIAELLKDVVTEHTVQMGRCCINWGCKEAILPLHYIDEKLHSRVFRVYLRYHPLQNIIEFRAKIVKQQLAFLKTVENKLKGALGNSKSYSGSGENFNSAVSFALPERAQYSKLTDSALWNLGEPVQYTREDGELDEEDFDELDDIREELLKITLMTPEKQRQWASSAPEMKEIPPDKFLQWSKILGGSDKWALVGSKLRLVTTVDIRFYTQNPQKGGNGQLILDLWRNSDCSYKELVDVLKSEDVHLDALAIQIEDHFTNAHVR